MKKLTMAVAVAVALFGSVTAARAESGAFIGGGRLALSYSTLYASGTSYYGDNYTYSAGDGGFGFEGGLVGRLAVIEGQMGVHVGANFFYRSVYNTSNMWNYDYSRSRYVYGADFNSSEMAVAVPVLFEINPFVLSGLNSSIYEMIFIQLGVQADYAFGYSEELNGTAVDKEDLWERKNFGIGIVLGAVGYFNSHLSLDVRYYYAFTNYYKKFPKWYPYTGSIGLSFYL